VGVAQQHGGVEGSVDRELVVGGVDRGQHLGVRAVDVPEGRQCQ
jgi:hypothetical protein